MSSSPPPTSTTTTTNGELPTRFATAGSTTVRTYVDPYLWIRFQRLSHFAKIPTRATPCSAGLDLYAAHDCVLPAQDKGLILTDLKVCLPLGCYGRIAPRSGLAVNHYIDVGAGVIDPDFCGNVGVLLFNHGKSEYIVHKGDRIAQLICEKFFQFPRIGEVESMDDETDRMENGFGSTGV